MKSLVRSLLVIVVASFLAACGVLGGAESEPELGSSSSEPLVIDNDAGTGATEDDGLASDAMADDAMAGSEADSNSAEESGEDSVAETSDSAISEEGFGGEAPSVRLATQMGTEYSEGTCFAGSDSGSGGEAVLVPCSDPHLIEVYAVATLPGEIDAPFIGIEASAQICGDRFRVATGVDIGLATIFGRSVLRPSETTWDLGQRTMTCYVTYPSPTTEMLVDIDPLRSFGQVSVFDLRAGDCLVSYDAEELRFELAGCDEPHEVEVFIAYEVPEEEYPGDQAIDDIATDLCFGRTFESFVGETYSSSDLISRACVQTSNLGYGATEPWYALFRMDLREQAPCRT